jgi:hypothetical protein
MERVILDEALARFVIRIFRLVFDRDVVPSHTTSLICVMGQPNSIGHKKNQYPHSKIVLDNAFERVLMARLGCRINPTEEVFMRPVKAPSSSFTGLNIFFRHLRRRFSLFGTLVIAAAMITLGATAGGKNQADPETACANLANVSNFPISPTQITLAT